MLKKLAFTLLCLILHSTVAFGLEPKLLPAPDASGKWGYIDAKNGKIVVEPRYGRAGMFQHSFAVVHMSFPSATYSVFKLDGEQLDILPMGDGILNEQGIEVLPVVNGQFVRPALYASRAEQNADTVIPGLFEVENPAGLGVFDANTGWLLRPAPRENIKFFADASFVFDSSTYIGPPPERNIYLAPEGYVIVHADAPSQSFFVEKKETDSSANTADEQSVLLGVASWNGEIIKEPAYTKIEIYPQCARWAGTLADGSLEIFNQHGAIASKLAATRQPQLRGASISFKQGYSFKELDPCTLEESPVQSSTQVPALPWAEFEDTEYKVLLRGDKVLLLDPQGDVVIPPLYEMLLPAGGAYWWGRYAGNKWILLDAETGCEVRMPQ